MAEPPPIPRTWVAPHSGSQGCRRQDRWSWACAVIKVGSSKNAPGRARRKCAAMTGPGGIPGAPRVAALVVLVGFSIALTLRVDAHRGPCCRCSRDDGPPGLQVVRPRESSVPTAAGYAAELVEGVRDDPAARRALMRELYEAEPGRPELHLPFRRAGLQFMGWQLRRGLLNPVDGPMPGSPWWRAVNERLLRDTAEARGHVIGLGGPPSSWSASCCVEFAERPSATRWYRAHNASIVAAYVENRALAESEGRAERFFINVILLRVLYAHALVAAPRLALGWLWPLGPVLGDPRLRFTGIFVSLSRVMPARYPLTRDLQWYLDAEQRFGRILDLGLVQPRLELLFSWSAAELAIPELGAMVVDGVPTYAWPAHDVDPWRQEADRWGRATRTILPARRPWRSDR